MHLHFVCSGNAFRSRLAEAYCRSVIPTKSISISSSGIIAKTDRFENGPINWYAMRLIMRHHLIPFMAWHETQTTKNILKNVDFLICMAPTHLDFCQKQLGYQGKFEVWDIPDMNEMKGFIPSTISGIKTDLNHLELSAQIFSMITQKVDNLLQRLL